MDDELTGEIPFQRLVSPQKQEQETFSENILRPNSLDDFIGQKDIRKQVQVLLDASKLRCEPPDHILFSGPAGLGKTTLAMIIAKELQTSLRVTSGPAIQNSGDLAAILSTIEEGEVLFIDEIHRLARPAEELLYVAMEDFRVDVVIGKGVGANAIPLSLPKFTVVGATTRTGLIPAPLRDRFGFVAHLDFYDEDELAEVISRSAKLLEITIKDNALVELAKRSRGTPRIANRLLRRVRDFVQVSGNNDITLDLMQKALDVYKIDSKGLDRLDLLVLETIIDRFSGGPVGLNTLAATIGEDSETIESFSESFLVRNGFITRTSKGRMATQLAFQHLKRQKNQNQLF